MVVVGRVVVSVVVDGEVVGVGFVVLVAVVSGVVVPEMDQPQWPSSL